MAVGCTPPEHFWHFTFDGDVEVRCACGETTARYVAGDVGYEVELVEPAPVALFSKVSPGGLLQAGDEVAVQMRIPADPPPVPVVERRGLTVHVDGVPALSLNSWVMTRPQDWAPAAREILWGRRR